MSFLTRAFSGGAPQINYTPGGFTNPTGFSATPTNAAGTLVSESPTLSSNIGSLQSTFQSAAGAFQNLASTVAPGFSQFRTAGLRDIANTFMQQRSNLKESLAQRRVLGSSFANSQFNQLAADQAQTEADFEARSYLQELDASNTLIQEQYSTQAQSFSTAINQSNIETQVAANLTAQNNQIGAQIASANAELSAGTIAGNAQLVGTLIGGGARIGAAFLSPNKAT